MPITFTSTNSQSDTDESVQLTWLDSFNYTYCKKGVFLGVIAFFRGQTISVAEASQYIDDHRDSTFARALSQPLRAWKSIKPCTSFSPNDMVQSTENKNPNTDDASTFTKQVPPLGNEKKLEELQKSNESQILQESQESHNLRDIVEDITIRCNDIKKDNDYLMSFNEDVRRYNNMLIEVNEGLIIKIHYNKKTCNLPIGKLKDEITTEKEIRNKILSEVCKDATSYETQTVTTYIDNISAVSIKFRKLYRDSWTRHYLMYHNSELSNNCIFSDREITRILLDILSAANKHVKEFIDNSRKYIALNFDLESYEDSSYDQKKQINKKIQDDYNSPSFYKNKSCIRCYILHQVTTLSQVNPSYIFNFLSFNNYIDNCISTMFFYILHNRFYRYAYIFRKKMSMRIQTI
ncbi:MAG: hypothetical protein KAG53_07835 [Endozoicomonadaceae bacterium]|nr:hypothetical protein [Endozoicomonadaceae bacterium]